MPIPRSLFDPSPPRDHDLVVVDGRWPDGLGGELFISAPHPASLGCSHPFFGEGVTYRLSLRPGAHGAPPDRFAWRHRVVDTPSARLRAERPDVFTTTPIGVQSPFGAVNAANTAPLPWGDRLFVSWDVGRPVEIDPLDLRFLGEVGHRDQWKVFEALSPQPVLPMVMTTAHPVIDPDRNVMWSVNLWWGQLHIVRWDGVGDIEMWPVDGAVLPQSVHTITQTRDWLVVGDCAFKIESQVLTGGDRTEPTNPSGPVFFIRKDELEATPCGQPVTATHITIAPEINHYYATYDDSDGVAIVFEHTENSDLALVQRAGDVDVLGRRCDPALSGLFGYPVSPDRMSLVVVDPTTGAVLHRAEQREPELLWSRQLNAMDWSSEGRLAPTLHHTVHHGWRPEAVTQTMLALYGDRADRSLLPPDETPPVLASTAIDDMALVAHWEFAFDDMPTSPTFVPRDPDTSAHTSRHAGSQPGGHDGWLVVPVLNDEQFRVEVFDADNVATGPVATLAAPGMRLPLVLHSAWVPQVVAADSAVPRVRFADELGRIDELPPDRIIAAQRVADDLDAGVPLM